MEILLSGDKPDAAAYVQRIYQSPAACKFLDSTRADFLEKDPELCAQIDCFYFTMRIERMNGFLVMQPVRG